MDLSPEDAALFGEDPFAEPAPAAPAKSAMPGHDGGVVTDGPGWSFVVCDVCNMPMTAHGKRPPGHQIDPSLCPNKASHDAALTSKPVIVPADSPKNDSTLVKEDKKRGKKAKAETTIAAPAVPSMSPLADLATGEIIGFVASPSPAVVIELGPKTLEALAKLLGK